MRGHALLSLVVGVGLAVGCGGSVSSAISTSDAGGGADTGGADAGGGGKDSGGVGIAPTSITLTVAQPGSPSPMPLAGAHVRLAYTATDFLEAQSDAMGVVHFDADATKCPCDVTAALAGYTAVSILGVTASVPGNIVLTPIRPLPTVHQFALGGSITGVNPSSRLQIAGYGIQTAVTHAGDAQYATTYGAAVGSTVGLGIVALEVDDSTPFGRAVNGVATPVTTGIAGSLSIPIAMPAPAIAAHQSSITINFPSSGEITAAMFSNASQPLNERSGGFVEQWRSDSGGHRAVGLANLDPSSGGSSLLHLQTFDGDLSPDVAGVWVATAVAPSDPPVLAPAVIVYAHSLVDGTSINVGQVDAITLDGESFATVTFATSSTGYDSTELVINSVQSASSAPIWFIYAPRGNVPMRALPYLPSGVMLGDLGGDVSSATIDAQVVKYAKNADSPWQSIVQDRSHLVGLQRAYTIDPTGR